MAQQLPDSLSETLDSSVSDDLHPSSDLPPPPPPPPPPPTTFGGGGASGSSSDLVLSRNLSSSRLNAKAPEFVPRSNSSSPPATLQLDLKHQQRIQVIPPQAQQASPPGLVHMYTAPNYMPVAQNHHYPHPSAYGHHVPAQVQYHHHHNHHHQNHHHHQHRQHYGGGGGVGIVDQREAGGAAAQASQGVVDSDHGVVSLRDGLSEEAIHKILNQVEYYFSDLNLATTDHLMRYINKDPEGYVPISVVASFKKIKALISSNSQLANILRNSEKLVVSEDGKKVRRQHLLTDTGMEELQSRIVVAENLPDDHCHQNLMKIFSTVGSVKTIRTCQPQTSNSGASSASRMVKSDGMLFSNKLHAFVEYDCVELAEKAVVDLNEEDNWRNGLRVRLMLKCTAKSNQGRVKQGGHEGDSNSKEDVVSTSEQQQPGEKHMEDSLPQFDAHLQENEGEEHVNDKEGMQKKGRSRGRGKGRGRPQYHQNHHNHHTGRGNSAGALPTNELPTVAKQPPGPRMPDGTRGFAMGRGKPVAVNTA